MPRLMFAILVLVLLALFLSVSVIAETPDADSEAAEPPIVPESDFPLDLTLLATALKTIAFAGGAGGLAYYVMKYIGPELAKSGWSDLWIRVVSLAVTAVIAWVAWSFLFWLIALPVPTSAQDWVNKLFAIAITSWGANQLIHGFGQKRNEHGGLT